MAQGTVTNCQLLVWSLQRAGQMEPHGVYMLTAEDDVIWHFGSCKL